MRWTSQLLILLLISVIIAMMAKARKDYLACKSQGGFQVLSTCFGVKP